MNIVLASGSPRRSELLEMLGVRNFIKDIPCGAEVVAEGASPEEAVLSLASQKAREVVSRQGAEDIIIAADTLVECDGEILGKPHDTADATRILKMLSGREHRVYTGVCVIKGELELLKSECTIVRFRTLTDEDIHSYISTGEPMDKAGAYGAQGKGSLFVKGIEGDFFNVMGLPLCLLGEMLSRLGLDLMSGV